MRGPNPDDMQEPAGNTIACAVVVDDEDRNWADADADAKIAAMTIAIPRIHNSSTARDDRAGNSVRNAAALRYASD